MLKIVNIEDKREEKKSIDSITPPPKVIEIGKLGKKQDYNLPIEELFHLLHKSEEKERVVVSGLGTFLKLKGRKFFLKTINELFQSFMTRGIVIFLYQCKGLLEGPKKDPRIGHFIDYIDTASTARPKIIFYNKNYLRTKDFNSEERWVEGVEKIPEAYEEMAGGMLKVLTEHNKDYYPDSLVEIIDRTSSFLILKERVPQFARIDDNCGVKNDNKSLFWDDLLKDIGDDSWDNYILRKLKSHDWDKFFTDWKEKTPFDRWVVFLVMKTFLLPPAITKVVEKSFSAEDLIPNLFSSILDYNYEAKDFWTIYDMRKKVIKNLLDISHGDDKENIWVDEYLSKSRTKGEGEIFYLTDLTQKEKERAIKVLSEPF